MLDKLHTEMVSELNAGKTGKNRIYAGLCMFALFALAVMVPGAAYAGDLADAVTPGVNSIVTEVTAVVGVVALVVLAVVGAKVVFGLLKKA